MMRIVGKSKLTVVLVVIAASLVWVGLRLTVLSDLGPSKEEPLARIRAVQGLVEVSPESSDFRRVGGEVSVPGGTKVRTGEEALAEIEYFDGSLTRVGPNTTYQVVALVREADRTVIIGKIGLGETFHDVKELTGSGSRFEIQESNAIAAVRGTRFAARCLPPLPCGIAVVEGIVEVTPSSGAAVSVGAGQRVTIDDEGLLGEVTEVSPDDPWLNRNQDLDGS